MVMTSLLKSDHDLSNKAYTAHRQDFTPETPDY